MIVVSLCHDTSHIRSVLEFSKPKTADILVFDSPFNILCVLLCAQVKERLHIQEPMDTVLDGECSVVGDTCTTYETELIGVLQVLVI